MSVARSVLQGDPAIWTVLVAAGEGRRFGGPKQLQPLGGRRVIDWAFDAAAAASHGVVIVAGAAQVDLLREGEGALVAGSGSEGTSPEPGGAGRAMDSGFRRNDGFGDTPVHPEGGAEGTPGGRPRIIVTAGGATRSDSVRAGIAAIPEDAQVIVVHDAARPLATPELFAAVTTAVAGGADGAVPAVPVTDTIRHTDGGPLDRSRLRAVQTPQAFRAGALRRAHEGAPEATDDATLVESAGGSVRLVAGEPDNLKITAPGDLHVAEALLAARGATPGVSREPEQPDEPHEPGEPERSGQPAQPTRPDQQERSRGEVSGRSPDTSGAGVPLVGIGFDVHPFSDDPERALVLGGAVFEGERGLAGHSDADAVAHACCDAILGIAGLGDIGSLFPDDDERWRGADSIALLAEAAKRVRRTGRRIGNIDCTVVAERPKLAPRRAEMQARLSEAAGAPVTVRGNRAESLGALGRGEGIACWAVAVLI